MPIHEIVATVILVAIVAVPFVAVAVVYRDRFPVWWSRLRAALAFDPRHQALLDPRER